MGEVAWQPRKRTVFWGKALARDSAVCLCTSPAFLGLGGLVWCLLPPCLLSNPGIIRSHLLNASPFFPTWLGRRELPLHQVGAFQGFRLASNSVPWNGTNPERLQPVLLGFWKLCLQTNPRVRGGSVPVALMLLSADPGPQAAKGEGQGCANWAQEEATRSLGKAGLGSRPPPSSCQEEPALLTVFGVMM